MITKELVSYITSQFNDGLDKNRIIAILQSQGGWGLSDITEAFLQIEQKKISQTPPPQVVSDINNKQDSPAPVEEKMLTLKKSETQKLNLENNEQNNDNNNVYARDSILGQATTQKQRAISFGKIIALVAIFLTVCAGTVYGYFEYIQKPTPYQILQQMIVENMDTSKTVPVREISSMNLNIEMSDDNKKGFANINISSDFVYDMSNFNQPLVEGFLALDGSAGEEIMQMNLKGTVDMKIANKKAYFRLRNVTPLPFFDISPYENQWFEFDLTLTEGFFDTSILEEKNALGLSEKNIQILTKFFSDSEIIIIEIINRSGQVESVKNAKGEKEYHLTFQVAKEDWAILIQKLYKAYKTEYKELISLFAELSGKPVNLGAQEEMAIQQMFTEIEKQLASKEAEKVFEVLANLSTETWVNTKTMRSRKTITAFNMKDIKIPAEYIKEMNIPTASEEMKLDISFSGTSEREYDVPVNIIAPTDTIMLDELLEQTGIGGASKRAEQAQLKGNLASIQAQSALYYDDHNLSYGTAKVANNLCEKGLFGDETVNNAIANAEEAGSGKDTAICAIGINGQSWAVSVDNKDRLGSWCVDSTGYAGDNAEKNTATMKTKKDTAVCGPENKIQVL